jgi:hypothetical protein
MPQPVCIGYLCVKLATCFKGVKDEFWLRIDNRLSASYYAGNCLGIGDMRKSIAASAVLLLKVIKDYCTDYSFKPLPIPSRNGSIFSVIMAS